MTRSDIRDAARWTAGLPVPRDSAAGRRFRGLVVDAALVLWAVAALHALFPTLFR